MKHVGGEVFTSKEMQMSTDDRHHDDNTPRLPRGKKVTVTSSSKSNEIFIYSWNDGHKDKNDILIPYVQLLSV